MNNTASYLRLYIIATVQGGASQTRRMLQQPSAATDTPRAAPRPWLRRRASGQTPAPIDSHVHIQGCSGAKRSCLRPNMPAHTRAHARAILHRRAARARTTVSQTYCCVTCFSSWRKSAMRACDTVAPKCAMRSGVGAEPPLASRKSHIPCVRSWACRT